jgi:hypothetical protein
VTKPALLDGVAIAAVRIQLEVALVAFCQAHHFAARLDGRSIDREGERLVLAGIANGPFLLRARQNRRALVSLDRHRKAAFSRGRQRSRERPIVRTAIGAGGLARILAYTEILNRTFTEPSFPMVTDDTFRTMPGRM